MAGRKKKNKMNPDLISIILIIISVVLEILIISKSGYLGQYFSKWIGEGFGVIKYVIAIGLFLLGIVTLKETKKQYMKVAIMQYLLFVILLSATFSGFQILSNKLIINKSISHVLEDASYLGANSQGGGVVGALVAVPLVKLVGSIASIVITLGLSIFLFIVIYKIKIGDIMSEIIEYINSELDIRRKSRMKKQKEKALHMKMSERDSSNKNDRELPPENEQLEISINGKNLKNNSEGKINKFIDLNSKKEEAEKVEKNTAEAEKLFKQEGEKKEEKIREILTLEHTLMVEDEKYEFPPIQLLKAGVKGALKNSKKTVTDTASKLQKTLYSFGVSAKVENVSVGPAITRYELKPAEGVRVSKIANLADDIALNLAAETIRIEAPIPGKQAVGIEVPNKENEIVHLRDVIETDAFNSSKSKLAFALGKDVAGEEVIADIAKMPHVLIAGATGSGKSVCINTLIASIIYKAKPSEVKLVMIDPKVVELSVYNGIPHLLIPVVTDPRKAAGALAWAVQEMVNRYNLFASKNVRDIKGYNEAVEREGDGGKLPQIVIIIDELSDLMMVAAKDVEDAICRLAQMARAAGMHLVIATQRPSVDVITGIIKANIPSRISFAVSSQIDSRTILDMVGAEKLLGKGDMLFYPAGAPKPVRVQGAFISDKEVEKIVEHLKENGEAKYNEDILEKIDNINKSDKDISEESQDDDTDPFLMEAIDLVVETGQASTSYIQRRFKVGYARAGRIIDQMEERGIISGYQGSKPREVLMSKERWAELKMSTTPEKVSNNNEVENDNLISE